MKKALCSDAFNDNLGDVFKKNEKEFNYNSYEFSYKFPFIPVLSFRSNQKQKSNFHRIDDLIMKNICFLFIVGHALLQKHAEYNRIEFSYMLFPTLLKNEYKQFQFNCLMIKSKIIVLSQHRKSLQIRYNTSRFSKRQYRYFGIYVLKTELTYQR